MESSLSDLPPVKYISKATGKEVGASRPLTPITEIPTVGPFFDEKLKPFAPKIIRSYSHIEADPEVTSTKNWKALTLLSLVAVALGLAGIVAVATAVFVFTAPVSLPLAAGVALAGGLVILGAAGTINFGIKWHKNSD